MPQYKFVDNDLKVASQDPSIQWIIVDYHKVMYISPNTCRVLVASVAHPLGRHTTRYLTSMEWTLSCRVMFTTMRGRN